MSAVITLLDGLADAAFAAEPTGRIVAWNAAAERLLGIPASRAVGAGCAALLQGRTDEGVPVCTANCPLLERLPRLAPGSPQSPGPCTVPAHPDLSVRSGGSGRTDVSVIAVPVVLEGAAVLLHLLRERSVPDLDPLTGCLRPWSFEPRAVALQDHAQRFSEPLAAALVDVDDLASITREHGRPAGDRAVAAVGAYLRYGRRDDAVCRWGGHEFALVLPAMTAAQAADRLRATLDMVREHVRVADRPVAFSAGAVDLDPSVPLSRAIHRAARLLDAAAREGGGRILTG